MQELSQEQNWITLNSEGNSISNGANLSQPKLSKMHCISYGACEHETRSDLCFEVKETQFP